MPRPAQLIQAAITLMVVSLALRGCVYSTLRQDEPKPAPPAESAAPPPAPAPAAPYVPRGDIPPGVQWGATSPGGWPPACLESNCPPVYHR